MYIYTKIFDIYKDFLKNVFAKGIDKIHTNAAVVLFTWNTLLSTIFRFECTEVSISKVMHILLDVQEIFDPELLEFMFSNLMPAEKLPNLVNGNSKKFLTMIQKGKSNLSLVFEENAFCDKQNQRYLSFEIAYSFMKLLNSVTEKIYYGELYKNCKESFLKNRDLSEESWVKSSRGSKAAKGTGNSGSAQFEWMFLFKEGILLRTNLMSFYMNFFIFPQNSLISEPEFDTAFDDPVEDPYKFVNLSHIKWDQVPKFLLEELKASKYIKTSIMHWEDQEVDFLIKEYYLKALFPMVFKYTSGVFHLYKFDKYYKKLWDVIFKITKNLEMYTAPGVYKLESKYQEENILQRVKNMLTD